MLNHKLDESRRNIVVIGASAGGFEALSQLFSRLPETLNATLFVVLHIGAHDNGSLPRALTRRSLLPCAFAEDDLDFGAGEIWLAPHDRHLRLRDGRMVVDRGPKDNGHRPAVDPLFRSAAHVYGSRVVGVVLSGALDCGSYGAQVIKAAGGTVLVQDPDEAMCDQMPRHAMQHVEPDHIACIAKIGELISELAATPAAVQTTSLKGLDDNMPTADNITCPLCNGSITEVTYNDLPRFGCHVGHTFSLAGILAAQNDEVEFALWAAIRALEEAAALARRSTRHCDQHTAGRLEEKALTLRRHADVIRRIVTDRVGWNAVSST